MANHIQSAVRMLPRHTVLRPEGRLVDLRRRRPRAYSAKPKLVYLERVAGAERRPHIVRAADVVQHHNHPDLRKFLIFIGRHSSHFYAQQLSVFHHIMLLWLQI